MRQPTSTPAVEDAPQTIDVDPGMALERIDSWVDGAIRLLPNVAIALVIVAVFWLLGRLVRRWVVRWAGARDRENLGQNLGGFARWVVVAIGAVLAATVVVPTLKPGDVVAGLGVSSVAIGFAFKDILQNWLAGMLILLRQPFEIGDQIEVEGFTGTVEQIETRATILKTFDGQRVVIPNSDIYTNSVLVKTAYELRRSEYDIGIGYADDIDTACRVVSEAIAGVGGVESDPPVQVLPWDLAASWVTLRARWWTASRKADTVQVRADVVRAVKSALDGAAIDMPYETQVHLFHDQTEAEDGDRAAQREGWPLPADREATTPRWRAAEEAPASLAGA